MSQKLKAAIQRMTQRTFVRYLFVGGSSYVIELSSLLIIFHATHNRAFATAVAFAIGFCVAFALQKVVAFREYSRQMRALARQGSWYTALSIWNYAFTVGFVALFPDRYLVVSRTVALVLMSSWNYILYKKVIFKTSPRSEPRY